MRIWLPLGFLLGCTALSTLLLGTLGTGLCVGIFGAGVVVFVLGVVWGAQSEAGSPGRVAVHFGFSKQAKDPLPSLIEDSADPSLCQLRAAPRARVPWGSRGLQLAEPRLVESFARGAGLTGLGEADRLRLARTIEWLSKSEADLTFELTADHEDPADEIEIAARDLADLVAGGQAATNVRYLVSRTT